MPKIVAGVVVPDSKLANAVEALVRDTETDLLYHHSNRVFFGGALARCRKSLTVDAELLYIGAMFHDMGLMEVFASETERFEMTATTLQPGSCIAAGLAITTLLT